jgi:phosphoribosyl-AMP cyclohydrolase
MKPEYFLDKLKFNADGLIPAIAQDTETREVLMMAYMNRESLLKTLSSGYAYYYSRSRQKLWQKGETSGHLQKIRQIRIDCDLDTVILEVEQTGVACHEGYPSCFFRSIIWDADDDDIQLKTIMDKPISCDS